MISSSISAVPPVLVKHGSNGNACSYHNGNWAKALPMPVEIASIVPLASPASRLASSEPAIRLRKGCILSRAVSIRMDVSAIKKL
jgi:hypothetical protein